MKRLSVNNQILKSLQLVVAVTLLEVAYLLQLAKLLLHPSLLNTTAGFCFA